MKMSFLNLRTKSQLKNNKTLRTSVPYNQALTIGVLFTIEDKKKHDEIKEFVHRLERDKKQVQVLAFLPRNKENYEFMFDFFTEDDISFWGNINSAGSEKFCNTSFDYLYYLDTKPNPILLNLLARSKGRCRIGKYWESGGSYFEMMIDSVANTESLFDGMLKYSTQLK
jgi:hypothetical protein